MRTLFFVIALFFIGNCVQAQTLKITGNLGAVNTSTPNKVNFCSTTPGGIDEAYVRVLNSSGVEILPASWGTMVVQVTNVRNITPGGISPFKDYFSNDINFNSSTTNRLIRAVITPTEYWGAATIVLKSSATGSVLSSVEVVAWPAFGASYTSSNFNTTYRFAGSSCITGPTNLSSGVNTFTFNPNTSNLNTFWKTKVSSTTAWYGVTSGSGLTSTLNIPETYPINQARTVTCGFDLVGQSCPAFGLAAQRLVGARTPRITGPSALCAGSSFSVDCNSTSTASVPPTISDIKFTYRWFKNGVVIAGATSKTYTPTTTGSYYCEVSQFNVNISLFPTLSWNTTASVVKNSNTVTLGNAAAMPTSAHTLTGTAGGTGYLNCQPITLTNTSTIAANVKQYRIELYDQNANLRGYTGVVAGTFTSLDVRTLGGNYLMNNANAGSNYKVRLYVGNECSMGAYSETIFNVIASPTGANVTGSVTTNGGGVSYSTYGSIGTPLAVGRYTTIFNGIPNFGSGAVVGDFKYQLYGWNGTAWVANGTLTTVCSFGTCGPTPQVNINSINFVSGQPPFFSNTALVPDNSIWKLSLILSNGCPPSLNLDFIFKITPGYFKSNPNNNVIENEYSNGCQVYPNPFTNSLAMQVSLENAGNVSVSVYSLDGKLMDNSINNKAFAEGEQLINLNTAHWAKGVYFYYVMVDNTSYKGKLIKD